MSRQIIAVLGISAAILVGLLSLWLFSLDGTQDIRTISSPTASDSDVTLAAATAPVTIPASPRPPTAVPTASSPAIDDLTLEVKIGQMILAGFDDEAEVSFAIESFHLGNVMLLEGNVADPFQVLTLTTTIQELAIKNNQNIGALVGVDQEGGAIVRMHSAYGFSDFPPAAVFGCLGDPALTEAAAEVIGQEMRSVGANINFAPVLDVNDNPANPVIGSRSFGQTPDLVSRQALAFVQGLRNAGVGTTTKHFPGHGNTSVDSHVALPTVFKTAEELRLTELAPFRDVISNANVDAVMTAHVLYPALDETWPATLSPSILSLLRDDLGFTGVVITDALTMGAIADTWTVGEAAVLAVEAGVDILAFKSSTDVEEVFASILAAVDDGRLTERRIDESVSRILTLKDSLGVGPDWAGDPADVGSLAHREVGAKVIGAALAAGCTG